MRFQASNGEKVNATTPALQSPDMTETGEPWAVSRVDTRSYSWAWRTQKTEVQCGEGRRLAEQTQAPSPAVAVGWQRRITDHPVV